VTDESVVEKCIAGCSHVFHLGAMVSVPATVSDPDRCFAVNVVGTKTVIGAASKAGVAGFVHTSTAAVYGSEPRLPSCEDDPICCESPYAASKACGELLIQAAARSAGFPGVALRLFNVFGPRQDPRNPYAAAISAFIDAATRARPVKIYGSGLQTRDFVPVSEVVRAFMHAGLHAHSHAGRCFNIGLGKETSVLQMAAMIQQSAGATTSYEFHDRRPGDVQRSCASLARTVELLEFEPRGDLAGFVRDLVRCTDTEAH
jgi:UDP-glucose 4-epimerase